MTDPPPVFAGVEGPSGAPPPSGLERDGEAAYAGFVTRTIALALDAVVLNVILFVVTTVVGLVLSLVIPGSESLTAKEVLAGAVVWAVSAGIYLVGFWTLAAQTPGMRAMRLRVVSLQSNHITLRQALKRLAGMVLSAIPFGAGFLLILVDDRRQGLADKLARTVVLYVPEADPAPPVRSLRTAAPPDPGPAP